ncbi:MAG TPA: FHA domain-containing protein [Polyangia bacterium]|jgi:pSer/pThr/pTyr-binding forkhead associated (FHA) protein|nr:FHA domain-containing protein [Polyangia bacterium]
MIKCGRCGNLNAGDVLFCQYCGTRLVEQRLPEVASVSPNPTSNRSTDRLIEQSAHAASLPAHVAPSPLQMPMPAPMQMPMHQPALPAAVRIVPNQQTGFRLVVVHRDGTDGITYNLLGDQIDIGRTEGDLLFEDPHLAPRHARIVASLTGRVLTPLETRNGVYVRLRGPVDLQDGDYLLMGKQVLRFETVSEPERNVRPALEHGVVVFGTPVRPPWARLRQITPAGVGRDIFHLARPDMVLGREIGDIIFSEDEFMSRRHAQVSYRNGRGHLEDLGSSNGTFLRLRGPHGLASGDLIRLGDELLRFEIG